MAQITHIQTLARPDPADLTAITDLDLWTGADGRAILYATSRAGEALSAFGLDGTGTASFLDGQILATDTTAVDVIRLDGTAYAMALGPTQPDPVAYRIAADGAIEGVAALTAGTAQEAATSLVLTETAAGSYVYGAGAGSGQVQSYRVNAEGGLDYAGAASLPQGAQRLHAVAAAADRMIAVSGDGANLISLAARADGTLAQRGFAGAAQGLGLSEISLVRTVTLEGQTFAIVAARGSSSLSVVRIAEDGTLTPVSHIIDDLGTRFHHVTAMDVVAGNGRAYVVAGGADDGISVFQLLGSGRLLHDATLADGFEMPMQNVSALVATVTDWTLDIFVGSAVETGIAQLSLDLGEAGQTLTGTVYGESLSGTEGGDIMDGGAGHDTVVGGAGNDVLLDSAGADEFWGGPGADRFVMDLDGDADWIRDFDPAVDILDLSGMPMLRSLLQLDIATRSDGARVAYREEAIWIRSHDGSPLTEAQLALAIAVGPGQMPVGSPGPQKEMRGSGAADVLAGNDLDNEVVGFAGDDVLLGGDGADRIRGGTGSDVIEGGAGPDLLIGEAGTAGFDWPSGQVFRLYRATLDRDPDPAGHADWLGKLLSGALTIDGIADGFVLSQEFRSTYGSTDDGAFVTLLYNNVLDRDPDPGGFADWTGKLQTGEMTRAQVVVGFSDSAEFVRRTEVDALSYSFHAARSEWLDEVFRLYRATLDRTPDVPGILSWTQKLARGETYLDVAQGFVGSAEFQSRYGQTSDTDFVTLLYNNVLDRAPDPGGLAHWLSRLEAGTPRVEVVRGFAESREFRAATRPESDGWIAAKLDADRLVAEDNDTLFGGFGADTFVFDTNVPAEAEIIDWEPWDRIELAGSSASDAEAAHALLVADTDDVVFAEGDLTLRFVSRDLTSIEPEQFILV